MITQQDPPPIPTAAQGVESPMTTNGEGAPPTPTESKNDSNGTNTSSDTSTSATGAEGEEESAKPFEMGKSSPKRLRIPNIEVDTPLDDSGLRQDGTLEVPPLTPDANASYYTGSPTPGQKGPSVILGHVDSLEDGPAVFYDLGKLKQGDEIKVTREDKSVATFVVHRTTMVTKETFPTNEIYGNTEGSELRLVTCGGEFDEATGSHQSNIVVFASLDKIDGKTLTQWRTRQDGPHAK